MAPRKINKRNNLKIKSNNLNNEKHNLKTFKDKKKRQKSAENLKWLNSIPENESYQKSVPKWLRDGHFKLKMGSHFSNSNSSEPEKDLPKEEVDEEEEEKEQELEERDDAMEKASGSESSDECNYLKSGLDQVASFIVESAIKFGEQRGVVIQDKNNPNLYEFTPTDHKFKDKFRKIWFRIPENDGKKFKWKTPTEISNTTGTKVLWRDNRSESVDKILPILKKIKNQDEEFEPADSEAERTESESEATYQERPRERLRKRNKRPKSEESAVTTSDKTYPLQRRKFRRDSIELGRQRLKAKSKSNKQDSSSRES